MADSEDVPVPISKPRRRLAGRVRSDLLQAREQLSSAPKNDHRIDSLSHAQRAAAAAAECVRQNRFEFERLPLKIAGEKPPAIHSNPDTRNQDVSDPLMQLRERIANVFDSSTAPASISVSLPSNVAKSNRWPSTNIFATMSPPPPTRRHTRPVDRPRNQRGDPAARDFADVGRETIRWRC